MNETHVTIVGRVISDPQHRQTRNDVDVTKFRMASNERRFDKESQQWVDGDSLFVEVACWRRLAFGVNACLAKGDPVVVTGRLYTRGFEVDGKRRSVTEMEAVAVGPDLARCTVSMHRRRDSRSAEATTVDHVEAADLGNPELAADDAPQPIAVAA